MVDKRAQYVHNYITKPLWIIILKYDEFICGFFCLGLFVSLPSNKFKLFYNVECTNQNTLF